MDIIGSGGPISGAGNGAAPGGNVIDGSDQTFMNDVIEPSKANPVIVDFWAPWCGPCRQLGPTIEKVVNEANGAVRLVKIDIDKNPGIAGQLGVQSIPAVVAFKDGRPVDAFMGAVPESQIRAFIEKLGVSAAPGEPSVSELLSTASDAFDSDDHNSALQLYAAALDLEPENFDALTGLAKTFLKLGDTEQARAVAEQIPELLRTKPAAAAIFSTLELVSHVAEPDEILDLKTAVQNSPDNFDARFDLANLLAGKGKHAEAADQLFAILEKNLKWKDGAAKEQLLKVFDAAGANSDVAKSGRKRLSSIVFR